MPTLKMYKCKEPECRFEFSDLPPEGRLEIGDVDRATGEIKNTRTVLPECPDCGSDQIEPVMENGKHKDA